MLSLDRSVRMTNNLISRGIAVILLRCWQLFSVATSGVFSERGLGGYTSHGNAFEIKKKILIV
jgi:hypothetical protein